MKNKLKKRWKKTQKRRKDERIWKKMKKDCKGREEKIQVLY